MRIRNRATAVAVATALTLGSSLSIALAEDAGATDGGTTVEDVAPAPDEVDDEDGVEFEAEVDRPTVMLGDEVVVEAKYKGKIDEVEDEDEAEEEDADDVEESDEVEDVEDGTDDGDVGEVVTLLSTETATSTAGSTLPSSVVFTVDYGDGTVVDLAIDELEVDEEEFEAETEGQPHVYAAEGTYTVTVTATPDVGDAQSLTLDVLVTTDPVAYDRGIDRFCPDEDDTEAATTDGTTDGGTTDGTVTTASVGFADIAGSAHGHAIACLAARGILAGRSVDAFEPGTPVTRAQVATMLARLAEQIGVTLPAETADAFEDDEESVHEYAINQLAELGLLGGTGDGEFEPGETLSREQMASVLVRLYEHATGEELSEVLDYFEDDEGSVHEGAINRAAAAGIATGRGLGVYARDADVTREQLSTFLARLLDALVEGGHTTA